MKEVTYEINRRTTESQAVFKIAKNNDGFLDRLLNGDREMLKSSVKELSVKSDMMLEFEYFPPLDGDNLKAILGKKHPLDYLYKEWNNNTELFSLI